MPEREPAALVGREESLALLVSALAEAGRGHPVVLLLAGEMGIGKTRLVHELARSGPVTVLSGACLPMAGDPVPFAPLVQGLRRLGGHGAVRQQLARSPALARLLPAGSGAAGPGSDEPAGSLEPSRLELFQAVLDLLGRLGAAGPVVHVVEDLHWADAGTLDLLRYLVGNLSSERVLLLVTYRPDQLPAGSGPAGWVAQVARLAGTRRVHLDRLGRDDTSRLVRSLTGAQPDPEVLESVFERSAGNPLFVEHLVLAGPAPGPLPATLGDLLADRVAALPRATGRLLGAVAVLGRPVGVEVLAGTLGRPVAKVEAALRPALDQHVLRLDEDRVQVAHPGFVEVVYAALLPSERTRLHRGAALALETEQAAVTGTSDDPVPAGELARHWFHAGDLPRALPAAVAAGQAAEQICAHGDAQAQFARAAELAQALPGSHDPVGLLARAAQAASLAGDHAAAIRLGQDALARATGRQVRAEISERLGTSHYLAGRGAEAERWYRAALELLGQDEPGELSARVYASLALCAAAWSRLDEAQEWGTRGLAAAQAAGARREQGRLHNALGLVASGQGRHEAGIGHLRQALAMALCSGPPGDAATAYINLSHVLGLAGRYEQVIATGRQGIEVLTRLGLSRQGGSLLAANTCEALLTTGRLPEAGELFEQVMGLHPRGITAAPMLIQGARLALVTGDLTQAWQRCEQARSLIEAEPAPPDAWLRETYEVAAAVELWAGRPAAAHELVQDGLALLADTDEQRFAAVLAALGVRALADQGETQRGAAARRALARGLAPLQQVAAVCHGRAEDVALGAWFAAEQARLLGPGQPPLWAAARTEWERLGQPVPALYAAWREAEARLDAGADAAGIATLRAAHTQAIRLGASLIRDELARLARWHHLDLPAPTQPAHPETGADGPPPEAALTDYRLTPRELEVLAGLAAGHTNREIAQALFISVKTASVHVSNIIRKLDVTGRQEAARVAHRLGLHE
ncbi:AAA family ATPase [Intrasporangium sp.]|uniref:helix-turn-helix transcriptional regulator n=1 Tax=Intrasporangium sp. TaxID=1925024 RepID=UPI00322140AA